MGRCEKIRIKNKKICTSDLTHYIAVYERNLASPEIGQTTPQEVFTLLKNVWAAKKSLRGVARFDGVNIEKEATDLYYIRFNPELPDLETGNHFINESGDYYRILRVTNNNGQNNFMIIQVTDRGDDTNEATEA